MTASDRQELRTKFEEFPTLRTERLVLRKIMLDDAGDWMRTWGDPRVADCTDMESAFTEVSQAEDLVRWWNERFAAGEGMRWAITLNDDRKLIGSCGLVCLDRNLPSAEIGYELAYDFWGKGIASEAARAILRFGFVEMGYHRIEALTNVGNAASAALLNALGFQEEGIKREAAFFRGAYHAQRMFALVRGDFDCA